MARSTKSERDEAIARLRDWIKPGDTVYTILRHVSRSGMQREIGIVLLSAEGGRTTDLHPNHAVATALGVRLGKRDGIIVGGCGMDMGFHLVYQMSATIYPEYACLGKGDDGRSRCPSNYHNNHRDRIRCEGIEATDTDRRRFCYRPDRYGLRWEVPADWPTGPARIVGTCQQCGEHVTADDRGSWVDQTGRDGCAEGVHSPGGLDDVVTLPGPLLACVTYDEGEAAPEGAITLADGQRVMVCPTCKGAGELPNPEGPERWDLTHTDGYALRHRWL